MRVGWRILRSALASIWRMRSRVTLNCRPTSSSVRRIAVAQAEAQFQHLALALGQAGEHVAELVLEQAVAGHVGRVLGGLVLDEIAEVGVVAVADGGLQRDGLLRHLQDGADAVDGHLHFVGDFLRGGLAAEFLEQAASARA